MSEHFDLTKLQKLDITEIEKVARQHANGRLTQKQQRLISYWSEQALQAIQCLAKTMSYSQEIALQSNTFSNNSANNSLRYVIQTSSSSPEEKRDAYRHSENINCETLRANVQMNKDNNDTYKYIAAAGVGAAILGVAYFLKSKE